MLRGKKRPLRRSFLRVQKVLRVQRVVVAASRQRKPYNRAYGPWKCTPSVACGDVSPEGGDLIYAQLLNS